MAGGGGHLGAGTGPAVLALAEAWGYPWATRPGLVETVEATSAASAASVGGGTEPGRGVRLEGLLAQALGRRRALEALSRWHDELDRLGEADPGLDVVTVADARYPANLRRVPGRPPFLFVRGQLVGGDGLAAAVVGARHCSPAGREAAAELADGLARAGVTVVSGLALGIDAAAHRGALAAGGRTVAVTGTGILRIYPPEHAQLAARMAAGPGAVVSQFWPATPPAAATFRARNVVTAGLSLATVVVEASARSGARLQARLAREQGRAVCLTGALVAAEGWARGLVESGRATAVEGAGGVLAAITPTIEAGHRPPREGPAEQLRLL
ncbi:MAG: DNA-processing protein DprA [Acidimicrobiales bacterium]